MTVVLIDDPQVGLLAVRPSLWDRALARLLAARWDRQLAQGVPPEHRVHLALRAGCLVDTRTRRWLAHSLTRLLTQAGTPRPGGATPLSPCGRRRLVDSGDVVARVIERLEHPAPLSSRGMAALCELLRDGSGPLYGRGSAAELRARLDEVDHALLPPDW